VLLGEPIVHIRGRQQAQAGVMVLTVIPGEEGMAVPSFQLPEERVCHSRADPEYRPHSCPNSSCATESTFKSSRLVHPGQWHEAQYAEPSRGRLREELDPLAAS
jgi:hypothetical protein